MTVVEEQSGAAAYFEKLRRAWADPAGGLVMKHTWAPQQSTQPHRRVKVKFEARAKKRYLNFPAHYLAA
jgi:hypothetical protein